jgi:hypothetical protein
MSESSHDDDTNAPETPTTRGSAPPVETPGPSVPPPTLPESETERREWADATRPDADILDAADPDEELIEEEESAAAAEVRAMGGPEIHDAEDPAMEAVYQAGGGEQEGFEAAEADLIENATHGDGGGNPLRDAFSPEAESDESDALYGEADDIPSTEVTSNPSDPDDPAAGPGLDADEGPRDRDRG